MYTYIINQIRIFDDEIIYESNTPVFNYSVNGPGASRFIHEHGNMFIGYWEWGYELEMYSWEPWEISPMGLLYKNILYIYMILYSWDPLEINSIGLLYIYMTENDIFSCEKR